MKPFIIRHRNRYNGASKDDNNPYWINAAVLEGWSVEIDLRYHRGKLYLGHDGPDYKIDLDFLVQHKKNLWIHAKDIKTLHWLTGTCCDLNYFFHDHDDCCLTSKKFIWCMPGQKYIPPNGIRLDFSTNPDYSGNIYAVCVDYIKKI